MEPSMSATKSSLAVAAGLAPVRDASPRPLPADEPRKIVPPPTACPPSQAVLDAIAQNVAMHGGRTFQTSRFSTVNMALEVALMREVRTPGWQAVK